MRTADLLSLFGFFIFVLAKQKFLSAFDRREAKKTQTSAQIKMYNFP